MALSFGFLQAATSSANSAAYTFPSQNLGAADADRWIVLVECARSISGGAASVSFTVAGVSMESVVTYVPGTSNRVSIRIAQIPAGTSGDVVCTYAATMARCGIALYRLVGTPTTYDTGTSNATNPTSAIDIADGGVLIGGGYENTAGSASWTGATERVDVVIEASNTFTSAGDGSMTLETGRTVTIDFVGTSSPIGAFASFTESATGTGDGSITLGALTASASGAGNPGGSADITLEALSILPAAAGTQNTIELYSYPTSATLVGVADKLNLQTLLDAHTAIRLDRAGDYATGGLSTLSISSGQQIYGCDETIVPPITIAGGTVGAVVSDIDADLTFPSSANVTRDCIFTRVKGNVTVSDGTVEECLFTSMELSRLSVTTNTAGRYFRNNRYIRARAQASTITHISINGDAARNSYGNVFIGYSSLTPNARFAEVYDQADIAFIGLSCEEWNWTNSTNAAGFTASDIGDLRIFGTNGKNGNNPTPAFDSGATNFTLFSSIIYNNGGDDVAFQDAAERYLFSQGFWYGITNSAANAFLLQNFRQGNEALNLDGSEVTGELTTGQKTHLEGMLSNAGRSGQQWPRYNFPSLPDPGGPSWDTDLGSKPDNTAALQATINANGIIEAGTYYITAPLVMNSSRSIRGSGAHNTCIIAKTADFSMVVFNDNIQTSLGAFVRITDITLQGGMNGIYADDAGMGPLAQITQSLISHVTFRNISGAAITVKHIYGVDNCFIDYVNFVNCGTGFLQIPNPATSGDVQSAYIDKVNFYRCQWVGNEKGIDWPARRTNNTNGWTECLFADNTSWAIRFLSTIVPFFANCEFVNNGGNSSTATVDSTGTLNFAGCYFAPGANGAVLLDASAAYVNLEGCEFDGTGSSGAAIFDGSSNKISALNCSKNASISLGTITEGTLFNCAFGDSPYDRFGVNVRSGTTTVFDSSAADPQGSQFLWGPSIANDDGATGTLEIAGSFGTTLGSLTITADGALGAITGGGFAATLGEATADGSGTLDIAGACSPGYLGEIGSSFGGTLNLAAAAGITLGTLGSSGSGVIAAGGFVSVCAFWVGGAGSNVGFISGVAAVTLGALTSSADAAADIAGTSDPVLESLISSAAGGETGDLRYAFLGSGSSTSTLTTYTFASQNLGTSDAERRIVVVEGGRPNSSVVPAIVSVTVGGVSASLVVDQTVSTVGRCGIWVAHVPSGTTGDVVITYAQAMLRCAMALHRVFGVAAVHDTDSSIDANPSVAIDVPDGGVAIAGGYHQSGDSATWTGLTERADFTVSINAFTSAGNGSMAEEAGRTVTIDFTVTNNPVGVFATFGTGGDITGNAAPSLEALAPSAAGTVTIAGDASATLGTLVSSAAGAVAIAGDAAITLGSLQISASGSSSGITGDAAITLGAIVSGSAGTVDIAAAAASGLGVLTSSAAGTVAIAGDASPALGPLTSSAAGAVAIAGAASPASGPLVSSAAGAVAIAGDAVITLGSLQISASGSSSGITGDAAITLGAILSSIAGTVNIAAAAAAELGALISSAVCAVAIAGAASPVTGQLVSSATGAVAIAGAAGITHGSLEISASGGVPTIFGNAIISLGSLSGSGTGSLEISGDGSISLLGLQIAVASDLDITGNLSETLVPPGISAIGGIYVLPPIHLDAPATAVATISAGGNAATTISAGGNAAATMSLI